MFSQRAPPTKPDRSLKSTWIFEVMKKITRLSVQEAFNLSQGHVLNSDIFYPYCICSIHLFHKSPFCCFALFFHEARSLSYINSFSYAEICKTIAFALAGIVLIKSLLFWKCEVLLLYWREIRCILQCCFYLLHHSSSGRAQSWADQKQHFRIGLAVERQVDFTSWVSFCKYKKC